MKEEHVAFVRNEARSKIEIVFVKDGWTYKAGTEESEEQPDKVEDAYIIRRWGLKNDGKAHVTEIRLRASEMKDFQNADLEEENE